MSLRVGRGKGALWDLFIRAIIPHKRAPPSWPNHLPKSPLLNVITLGIRFQQMNLGGHKHSVYSTHPFAFIIIQGIARNPQNMIWRNLKDQSPKHHSDLKSNLEFCIDVLFTHWWCTDLLQFSFGTNHLQLAQTPQLKVESSMTVFISYASYTSGVLKPSALMCD